MTDMTDVQRRILQDFENLAKTATFKRSALRSTRREWEAERVNLMKAGWLETGIAIAGRGHTVTSSGRAALDEMDRLDTLKEQEAQHDRSDAGTEENPSVHPSVPG